MSAASLRERLAPIVARLYPAGSVDVLDAVLALAERWRGRLADRPMTPPPDESTAYLITYGDAFRRPGEAPLRTLADVLTRIGDAVSDVHLLPIYPWTSDDGFAVVDHRRVNPELGTWDDVAALRADHALMLDFVANHVSSSSPWFTEWLARDPARAGWFLEPGGSFDTSRVVRPRTTPLVHPFVRPDGTTAWPWTTFGPDQVDVDVRTPAVLLELTDVLLGYVARGATTIRLDAIGFLWKESGTTCLHRPGTHDVIRAWRALVDDLAPGTRLLTETNVPHAENVTYFGAGDDEAHMVYQFALPPLTLHAFVTGRATALTDWADSIGPVSRTATWFNFLASHDGIGLRPTHDLLSDDDRELLVQRTLARGGRVSWARAADGTRQVYELNTTYLDALVDPADPDPDAAAVIRGLAAHAILLSLVGVPAIYYHSLLGSGQDQEGVAASAINRRINREMLDADRLGDQLRDSPRRRGMLAGLRHLLAVRRTQPAFSPFAGQQVERLDDRVLVLRRAPGTDHEVVCAVNVSGEDVRLRSLGGTDLLTGAEHEGLRLPPHGYAWLRRTT